MPFVAQNFKDLVGPPISAGFLNNLDQMVNNTLGGTPTVPAVQAALGITTAAGLAVFSGVDSGVVNASVITLASLNPLPALAPPLTLGLLVRYKPLAVNTGPATLNFAGGGAVAVVNWFGTALTGGELNGITLLEWNGAAWQLVMSACPIGNQRTTAEVAGLVVPTNYTFFPGHMSRYSGAGDGATDNVAALLANIAQASQFGGAKVYAPVGVWNLNSALFPINLPANVLIDGDGKDMTVWNVTGVGTPYIFTATNTVGNNKFRNATWHGNSQSATAFADGGLLKFQMTTGAAALAEKFEFFECRFENFKGSYWIWFLNQSLSFVMRNGRFINCDAQSFNGNNRSPTGIADSATVISVQGATAGAFAGVLDFVATGCWADGTFIKSFMNVWQGTSRCGTLKNQLLNFGATTNSNCGAYALMSYDNSSGVNPPKDFFFYDDDIISPLSCGVYIQGASGKIRPGLYSGQSDTANGTIPKGAIAINGGGDVEILGGGELKDNYIGIMMVTDNGTLGPLVSRYNVDDALINSSVANAFGIIVKPNVSTGNAATVRISPAVQARLTDASSVGMLVDFSAGGQSMLALEVLGATFDAAQGLIGNFSAGSPNILHTVIKAKFRNCTGPNALSWASATTGVVEISSEFLGGWGAATTVLDVSNTQKLALYDNLFCNMTSGTGVMARTVGTQGVMGNNRYVNVTPTYRLSNAGSDLGRVTPAFTGTQGDFVQDLFPVESGAVASKYIRQGWNYGTAWLEVRTLTGN